ncbi:hypothetical protein BSQ49_03800 [Liquorilactobacillus hordei]|uniref:Uncharacterized protein n=2 Tax=Liquorilactobacillus hordei TaxID=468911 RepID=A0A0R1MRQ0_9LACO|nr:hypothetical protein BSQ49_03800 [Liquorilactobacillus hordei]KRL07874.1 hypothetical protein FC92_GL001445 [Liquorilactobacillus hordei DSM 19519]MBZ2405340.1 hypothetical protein [Liquorilactobacillus hordei]
MNPDLRKLYIKLLKWSVTTAFLMISRQFVNNQVFDIVIILCVCYCVGIFVMCFYFQLFGKK